MKIAWLVFAFLVGGGVAAAADDAPAGDAAAGAALYQSVCLVCHGPNGASVIPTQPILAGQHDEYLRRQLLAYKNGERENAVMSPQAANLSDKDIADVSRYLSAQPPVIAGAAADADLAAGEEIYRHGDIARGLPACSACHGPAGAGIAPNFPRLSGQHADYTASSLRAYADGSRLSDGDIMLSIAAQLSEEEIQSLAAYISGLSY